MTQRWAQPFIANKNLPLLADAILDFSPASFDQVVNAIEDKKPLQPQILPLETPRTLGDILVSQTAPATPR